MEGYSGTEYRSQHYLSVEYLIVGYSQRCLYLAVCIVKGFTYLVGHQFAYAFKIAAEAQHILLYIHIAELGHILVDNRVMVGKIDYVHNNVLICLSTRMSTVLISMFGNRGKKKRLR